MGQQTPRQESRRPITRPNFPSSNPEIPSPKINSQSQVSDLDCGPVKSTEPIFRKVLAPTGSSVTENTVLSEFSEVSHDYDEFWAVNDGAQ